MKQASRFSFLRNKLALGALAACAAGGAAHAEIIVGTGSPGSANTGQTTASRLVPAPGGAGHMLVTPYYTVQNGHVTTISIHNSDLSNGKAVKVRYRAAASADNVLDFTLLLAPGDVFSAAVRKNTAGVTEIVFQDASCTLPQLPIGVAQPFIPARLNQALSPQDRQTQLAEGYVEIVQTADIPDLAVYGPGNNANSALFVAVKNRDCGSPAITGALFTNHTVEATAAARGLAGPTGGLFGKWSIASDSLDTSFAGSMQAIQAIDEAGNSARGNFVLYPQFANLHPAPDGQTADPLLRTQSFASKSATGVTGGTVNGPVVPAALFDFPDLSTPYTAGNAAAGPAGPLQQASQLSAAYAVRAARNEYNADPVTLAATDWVFTMATRRFSVAADYPGHRRLYSLVSVDGKEFFHDGNLTASPADPAVSCLQGGQATYLDRNGAIRTGPKSQPYCGVASVLSFGGQPTSLLGARVAHSNTGSDSFAAGWAQAGFADPATLIGVPVTAAGFTATGPALVPPNSPRPLPRSSFSANTEHSVTR